MQVSERKVLRFHKITDITDAIDTLKQRLIRELSANKRVLWLVPGGSNIPLSVAIIENLPSTVNANLAVMLTDERYGKYNHPNSNMLQLETAGFQTNKATVVPVLTPDNSSLEATCARYNEAVSVAFKAADIIIGQFGIGNDGHIAGILPDSPAVVSENLVAGYGGGDFMRITLTPKALRQVDVAYVFAYGNTKRGALDDLMNKELSLKKQPAQILKQIPESYIYNNQIGEEP